MKIYLYELRELFIDKPGCLLTCDELEAEEKVKTYTFKKYCSPRIYKSEIGCVKKSYSNQLYLLEKDDEKAKKLFRNYLSERLDAEKKRHAEECNKINKLLSACQEFDCSLAE